MTRQEIENAAIEHFNATHKYPSQSAHVIEYPDGTVEVKIGDGWDTYTLEFNSETEEFN